MINSRKLDDKTYEELMAAAVAQIPLYSREWTNLNPSDPGITILENFSAFQAVQQSSINEVTDPVRRKLLKMAGCVPKEGSCARVLLKPEGLTDSVLLPACQKFYTGNTCFETREETDISSGRIIGIYTESEDGRITDYTEALNSEIPVSAELFGEKPQAGRSLILMLSHPPKNKEIFRLFVKTEDRFPRNPPKSGLENRFAKTFWSYATEQGYETAEAEDDTFAFLTSGEIRIPVGSTPLKRCRLNDREGYLFRCTLHKAEYDNPPRVLKIDGFLFEVIQRDSKAVTLTAASADKIEVFCAAAEEGYLFVYGKRRKSDPFYYEYTEFMGEEKRGCFYEKKKTGYGRYELTFDKERFGYAPAKHCEDGVKIVCCTYEMMLHRKRGILYGYDDQEISMEPFVQIEKESLILMLRQKETDRRARCTFVSFGQQEREGFHFAYDQEKQVLRIKDCAGLEEAEVFLCGCALYQGEDGNVRERNEFHTEHPVLKQSFQNPAGGMGGALPETLSEAVLRFTAEQNLLQSAVTAEDYEYLVKQIPGLCIHKVRAVPDRQKNRVTLYLKPYRKEKFPGLPPHYQEIISEYLEQRRLLTTQIDILPPVYLPIEVQAVIYVKQYYKNCREVIEAVIKRELDHTEGDQEMGETISFHKVMRAVEDLDCVEYIHDLKLIPGKRNKVIREGMDLKPEEGCLCYPGELSIELYTQKPGSY